MPWMGPRLTKEEHDLAAIMSKGLQLSNSLCLFLPRNINQSKVKQCWWKAYMRSKQSGKQLTGK